MGSSEIEKKLLNDYLSQEDLNSLIQNTTCLKTLNCLLQIKQQRISEGKCEKLSFSIEPIYINDNFNIIDLKNQVLENALQLVEEPDKHILQAIKYLTKKLYFSQNEKELYDSLNLLNVIIHYYKDKNVSLNIQKELDGIYEPVIKVISNAPKRLTNYTLLHFLPNYIDICSEQTSSLLLQNIFELVKTTNRLHIICLLFDKFAFKPFHLNTRNDYWLLLETCISNKDSYLQKQAAYLLSKSVDRYSKNHHLLPTYLKLENDLDDFEKIWKNYFILLDVSNEKQLHIIEPSLPLFNSIRSLHPLWRISLYKIYLNHSQNSIVYTVAMFILQNETEWSNFSQILQALLAAINKNEFSVNSKRVFEKFGNFSTKLDNKQFEFLVQESLSLTWVPAAIWSLYSNIFDERTQFQLSFSLLEDLFKKLKFLPHTYIRDGCLRILLNYCITNFVYDSLNELLKFSSLLLKINETTFENFIQKNREKILNHIDNLLEEFVKARNETCNLLQIEIVIRIFKIIQTKISTILNFEKFSEVTDLVHFHLFDYFAFNDVEKYIINRIDSIQIHENQKLLVLLSKNICSSRIIKKSVEILLENDRKRFTSRQQILAFGIINNTSYCEDYGKIVNFWKSRFLLSNEKIDDSITAAFLQLYHKYLSKNSTDEDEILEAINILQNVFDSQSETVFIIIENIQVLLKHSNSLITSRFIDRCFEEFLNLCKTSNFKTTANSFLSQLYHSESLENYILFSKLPTFTQRLLKISNNYNTIACIISEKIAKLSEFNPQKAVIFIPVIVEFILHGIIINKNERTEYSVCQDIGRKLSLDENNPNLEEISVRLWGLEAMLHLVKNHDSGENVANQFVNLLVGQYMKHFNKRYFPDSQIHLHKLRIMQALLLLHRYITKEKSNLVNIIIESFLLESHQPSVKHLMQWLLINLLKNDCSLKPIEDKLKKFDNSRPSTVSGFIPVIYHLTLYQDEEAWDQIVEMLLPCTMGPQFKLRVYSQVALLKLYEKATEKKYKSFLNKNKFLYTSLQQVVEASGDALHETININQEFLDYFPLENCDCSTIYHTIPKTNKVAVYEWENLQKCAINKQFKHLSFGIEAWHNDTLDEYENQTPPTEFSNIQKKITPWKDLINDNSTEYTNDFILVTTLLEKPANLGGLSRTCEVFGIKKLAMKTSKITSDKEFKSLSMSSENWVDIMEVKSEDLQSFILDIKTKGYCVIGAEQTSESVKLQEFKFAKMTVLVLGNEKEGIQANIIPLLDNCIEIPQFGVVRSLNVHVAGAIIIWEYCKQHQL